MYSPFLPPKISLALFAITSLIFMLVEVPAPPCIISIGNSLSNLPVITSSPALTIASLSLSSNTPSWLFALAAAILTAAKALINRG